MAEENQPIGSEDPLELPTQRHLMVSRRRAAGVVSVFLLVAVMNVVQLATFFSSDPSLQLVFKHSLNGNQLNRELRIRASKDACHHGLEIRNVALPERIRQRSDPSLEDDPFNHVVDNRGPTSRRRSPSRVSREAHLRDNRDDDHDERNTSRTSRRGIRSEKSRPALRGGHDHGKRDDEPIPRELDVRKYAYVSSK
jgi:hypothetical protein